MAGESKVAVRDVEFVFENLKLKLQVDKTIHDIKNMYVCGITDSYEYNFAVTTDAKSTEEKIISIGDQFFAGGESTKVFIVQIEKETFICEMIQRFNDLWIALIESLPTYPIKNHPKLTHKEDTYTTDGNEPIYVDCPDKFMFVHDEKVTHIKM